MSASANCAHCNATLDTADLVRLWDGESYCRDCVEGQLPGLADYAASHQRLEEAAPREVVHQVRQQIVSYFVIGLLFGVLMAIGSYSAYGLLGVLVGILFGMGVAACAALIQIPGRIWLARGSVPTVSVENGLVTVDRRLFPQTSLPLKTYRWSFGKSRRDSMLRFTFVDNVDVILLEVPARFLSFRPVQRVACGWSEDTRKRWAAFLTLAAVPRSK